MDEKYRQLKEYIRSTLAKGITDDKIKSALVKAGWPEDSVELAFSELQAKPKHAGHIGYLAEDIMEQEIVKIKPETKMSAVLDVLRETGKGYVLVVDGAKPMGIITGKDVFSNIDASGKIDVSASCRDVMSSPVMSCRHDQSLLEVCTKMKLEDIDRIPVLKNGKLAGIITATSLVDFMSYG